jgi:hypothetical protein
MIFEALESNFEALETEFDALKMNFVAGSGEKVAGEGDHVMPDPRMTQSWVTARLTAGSGLVGRDPRRLGGWVGLRRFETHASLPPKNQKKGKKKKKKKKLGWFSTAV